MSELRDKIKEYYWDNMVPANTPIEREDVDKLLDAILDASRAEAISVIDTKCDRIRAEIGQVQAHLSDRIDELMRRVKPKLYPDPPAPELDGRTAWEALHPKKSGWFIVKRSLYSHKKQYIHLCSSENDANSVRDTLNKEVGCGFYSVEPAY